MSRKAVRRGIRKYFIRATLVSDIVLMKNRKDSKKGVLEWGFFFDDEAVLIPIDKADWLFIALVALEVRQRCCFADVYIT